MAEGQSHKFGLVQSFYIDTDAYSQRDREMFVCGVEFEMIRQLVMKPGRIVTTIHRENESRIRMMAGKLGRKAEINACEPERDPDGTWSYLLVN